MTSIDTSKVNDILRDEIAGLKAILAVNKRPLPTKINYNNICFDKFVTDMKYNPRPIFNSANEFAEKKIQNEQFDFVIMGHKHKAEVTSFGNGVYVNLGHWLSFPATYAEFDGQILELKKTT